MSLTRHFIVGVLGDLRRSRSRRLLLRTHRFVSSATGKTAEQFSPTPFRFSPYYAHKKISLTGYLWA